MAPNGWTVRSMDWPQRSRTEKLVVKIYERFIESLLSTFIGDYTVEFNILL